MHSPPLQSNSSVVSGLRFRLQMAYEAPIRNWRIRHGYSDGIFACWLVRHGRVTVTQGGRTLIGTRGTWVFLPAWCRRTQIFSIDARILSIRFACQDELHGQTVFSDGLPAVFPAEPYTELNACAEELVSLMVDAGAVAVTGRQPQDFRQHAAFMQFIAYWFARCADLGCLADPPIQHDSRLQPVRRILEEHQGLRPVPYEEIVRETGLSKVQIDRLFRKDHGCTPAGWLDRLMLDRVEQMVADPRYSLRAIAQQHGFTDQTHLVRWYRKLVGMTPGRRRRATAHE